MKTRKKIATRRKRRKRKLIVAVTLLFFASLVVFLVLNRGNPEEIPAEEYFSISEDDIVPFGFTHQNGTVLELQSVSFKLTAVKGDAHGVVISAGAFRYETIEIINKGETRTINLVYSPPYYTSKLEKEGFVIELTIRSVEAKGKMTIYIPPDSVPPGRD